MKNANNSNIDLSEKARPVEEVIIRLTQAVKELECDVEYHSMFLKAEFVSQIKQEMRKKGISKNALAERLGKSRQYIGRVLNENANFTIESMVSICCALNLNIELTTSEKQRSSMICGDDIESDMWKVICLFPDYPNSEGTEEFFKQIG